MRKIQLAPWALAAVMAVTLPGAHSAWAASKSASVRLLKAQLPDGITLSEASISQTASALHAAVLQRPDLAPTLTEIAVVAKTPKRGEGSLSCNNLNKIVNGAVSAAPEKSSDIVQMALSMHPECADALNSFLNNPSNPGAGFNAPVDEYGGFGVGFGPGFPGSPGFVGSPPSGAIALPPTIATAILNG